MPLNPNDLKAMKITLVSMPVVNLQTPSLALTQLRHKAEILFGKAVSVSICYLYHYFAKSVGSDFYEFLLYEMNSGIGEWFFKQLAFKDYNDNSDDYFKYYFVGKMKN